MFAERLLSVNIITAVARSTEAVQFVEKWLVYLPMEERRSRSGT
jgi:hypothetical protein